MTILLSVKCGCCQNLDEHQNENVLNLQNLMRKKVKLVLKVKVVSVLMMPMLTVNSANIDQDHSNSSVPYDTAGTKSSGEDSIMEFTESSESQSIVDPKVVPPVNYGSRNLQGKAKSSVISKLLPWKQPVVRSGHHSMPAVVPNRPTLGVKDKNC